MSLVTIERDLIAGEVSDSSSIADSSDSKSQNEDFLAFKGTAVLQNTQGRRRSSIITDIDYKSNYQIKFMSQMACGLLQDSIGTCLKKTVQLLRKEDNLRLIVELEKLSHLDVGHRCFCLISNVSEQFAILGVDIFRDCSTLGLFKPISQDVTVILDGDGGFHIESIDKAKLFFKPTSVHSLWTTYQKLLKVCELARINKFHSDSIDKKWLEHYRTHCEISNKTKQAEWNKMPSSDLTFNSNVAPDSGIGEIVFGSEKHEEMQIIDELRRIMKDEDMDNATVVSLRTKLQEKIPDLDLKRHRAFIAEQILVIYGQMDRASEILPFLYLGSVYNAGYLEGLNELNITHILNVTKEVECYYPDKFKYKVIQVEDRENVNLRCYFDEAQKFINDAKNTNSKCLVHCQRGISRSASIVISFVMKDHNMSYKEALKYVKDKRACVQPNEGFEEQLKEYEGILQASSNRHNSKFRVHSTGEIKTYDSLKIESRPKSEVNYNNYLALPDPSSAGCRHGTYSSTEALIYTDNIEKSELPTSDIEFLSTNQLSNIEPHQSLHKSTEEVDIRTIDFEKRSFRVKNDKSWIKIENDTEKDIETSVGSI